MAKVVGVRGWVGQGSDGCGVLSRDMALCVTAYHYITIQCTARCTLW